MYLGSGSTMMIFPIIKSITNTRDLVHIEMIHRTNYRQLLVTDSMLVVTNAHLM